MQEKADIGIIGLAVMGENLALNMESKGFTVAVYNRTVPGVEEGIVAHFMNGRGQGKKFIGLEKIEDFEPALLKALELNKPVLIDVLVEKDIYPPFKLTRV